MSGGDVMIGVERRLAIAGDLDVRAFGTQISRVAVRQRGHIFNYQYLR